MAIRAEAEQSGPPDRRPYVLFAGKLAANKGASTLLPATADLSLPLVVAGDGPARAEVEAAARTSRRDVRFLGWLERPELLRWMRHAAMLIFPSAWPEPLGRVLIEASALGCPIVAMQTGGVGDVVVHEETGLLARSADELRAHARRLQHDSMLAARLGARRGAAWTRSLIPTWSRSNMRRYTRRCSIAPRRRPESAREPRTAADRPAVAGGGALARRRGPGTPCRGHDAAPRAARRPRDAGDAAAGTAHGGRGSCGVARPGRCRCGRATRDAVRTVRHVSVRGAARDDDPRPRDRLPSVRPARRTGGATARRTREACRSSMDSAQARWATPRRGRETG